MLLQDKVAVVTGASRGIGRDTALKLAREGAKVVINYVSNEQKANEVLETIISAGYEASIYKANVSEEEEARDLILYAINTYGRLDILVNNAGITKDKFLINMSVEEWDGVLKNNLTGPFLCSKYALRQMLKQKKGKIINVSSITGVLGNKGQSNYAASKAGLVGLTKAIAQEYSYKGITANAIAPGVIVTEMTESLSPDEHQYKLNSILRGSPGKVSEVAELILFLSSDLSDFINGEVIRIDGGIRF